MDGQVGARQPGDPKLGPYELLGREVEAALSPAPSARPTAARVAAALGAAPRRYPDHAIAHHPDRAGDPATGRRPRAGW